MARQFGIPSALAAAMPADRPLARTTDPAVPVAGKIQSSRQILPPLGGTDSCDSRRTFFIISPFERGQIAQTAVDIIAFVFGIGFLCLCTLGIAAAISVLIYYAVI